MTSIRLLVGLSLALAGCYSPRFGSPGFYCHAEDNPACPPGQGCLAGRCVNLGQTPDGGHGLDGSTGNDAAPPLDFSGVDLAGADLKTSPDGSTVCALRINELQTAGSGGASDEFIELFSTCGAATLPNGYELVYRSASGTSDVVLVTFTGQSISSFFVCGQTSFSGTADVRYSASGEPADGIELANLFLDKGLISYTQGQKSPRRNFDADPKKDITSLPLIVMTNHGTAAAAELAAGALQGDKRATLVGERTYGDASVLRPISMDDGSAIILSVAKYYTPDGKSIQDNGVVPDNVVIESEASAGDVDDDTDVARPTPAPSDKKPADDVILQKAIQLAQGKD